MIAHLEDVLNVEGEAETEEAYYASMQRMINSGMWSMQGSMGRSMMDALESGRCMLGTKPAQDYWGNFIPARHMVQEGTKGSRQHVVNCCGEEWAAQMEEVEA